MSTPPASPDSLQLRGAPASSARLSKKAALFAAIALGAIVCVILLNVSKDKPAKAAGEATQAKELAPALNAAKNITRDVPDVIAAPLPPPPSEPVVSHSAPPLERTPVKSAAEEARLADTSVPKFVAGESVAGPRAVAGWSAESAAQGEDTDPNTSADTSDNTNLPPRGGELGQGLRRVGHFPTAADGQSGQESDLNHQDEKAAFQVRSRKSPYLDSQLTAPRSPFELKTGTVIPGLLIGAANSDLPGEIIAQVSQGVYDTASGEHLLIPQGTRLYGHYDSSVSFGQGRLLVRWDRLIFPNAYTLELQGMSGHDEGGNAGFADRVNNHYGRMFGFALLTSVFSAGAQLSQPQQANVLATPGNGQVAAAAVGQQMAQLGADIARRNLQVQPTLQIRKGYRFNVMVNQDIVFPGPYTP